MQKIKQWLTTETCVLAVLVMVAVIIITLVTVDNIRDMELKETAQMTALKTDMENEVAVLQSRAEELQISLTAAEHDKVLLTNKIAILEEELELLENDLTFYREIHLTDVEFDLVCRVVAAEARGEDYEGKMAVAQVIRDRYLSRKYGATISDVVYMPNQFAEPWYGDLTEYADILDAVNEIFSGKNVFDGDAIYFFNPGVSDPAAVSMLRKGSAYFGVIGRHEFRGWNK